MLPPISGVNPRIDWNVSKMSLVVLDFVGALRGGWLQMGGWFRWEFVVVGDCGSFVGDSVVGVGCVELCDGVVLRFCLVDRVVYPRCFGDVSRVEVGTR